MSHSDQACPDIGNIEQRNATDTLAQFRAWLDSAIEAETNSEQFWASTYVRDNFEEITERYPPINAERSS